MCPTFAIHSITREKAVALVRTHLKIKLLTVVVVLGQFNYHLYSWLVPNKERKSLADRSGY